MLLEDPLQHKPTALPMRALALAMLVLLAAAQGATASTLPDDSTFYAFKPMDIPFASSWEGCQSGNRVAAIEIWVRKESWKCGQEKCRVNSDYCWCDYDVIDTWGAITGIKLHFTDKVQSVPRSATIGYPPQGRSSDGFLSINAGEYVTKVVLALNGDGADPRLGSISIETSKGQKLYVTSQVSHDNRCEDGTCPSYKTTVISRSISENNEWLGSGIFCGLLSKAYIDSSSKGIQDVSFVFLQRIVDARVLSMTYPPNWRDMMPPLNPIVSATVKLDNRKGPATTLTLSSKRGTTTTGSITITNGSSVASDIEVKFGFQTPKVMEPLLKEEMSIYLKSSWDLSTEQETSSTFSDAEVVTDACKVTVAANTWSQVAFLQYQGTYTLPYTGRMKLTFITGAEMVFDTSGTISALAEASTSCVACPLDANGCCPEMSKDGCPKGRVPRRSLAAGVASADAAVPSPLTLAAAAGAGAGGAASLVGRRLQAADPSLFVQTTYVGQNINTAREVGTANCLDGFWLASIKAFKCSQTANYGSCGIGLYYTNGIVNRVERLGRTDGDSLGECQFGPNDAVVSGTIWDNNRCSGSQCRWGKLELVKSDGTKCSMQVAGFVDGQPQRVGPSSRENIGSGLLCGVRGAAASDVDGLALIFMRAVTGVDVGNYSVRPADFGVPAASSFGISYLDNRLNSTGELSTDIETTHSVTQSWREKSQNKMGSQTKFEYKSTMGEVINTGLTASQAITQTDTIASSGSVADSNTLKMTVVAPVSADTCVQITKTRIGGARSGIVFNATRTITFDTGVTRTISTQGFTEFNVSAAWELNTQYCRRASQQGRLSPSQRAARAPTAYVVRATRTGLQVANVLKQLSVAYGINVKRLRQLNPSLPLTLKKGTSAKIVLKRQLPSPRPLPHTASYLLPARTTRDALLRKVAAEFGVPLKTLVQLNARRLPATLKKGSTVRVQLRQPGGKRPG